MCPLPEVSPSLIVGPGMVLQKPCRGTIPRCSRAESAIGEIFTPGDRRDAAKTGGLGGYTFSRVVPTCDTETPLSGTIRDFAAGAPETWVELLGLPSPAVDAWSAR
jgi:hypothetical protein